ncbi:MAG: hypothetical protein ABIE84_00315 [bacterium]
MNKKGSALLIVILLISLFLSLSALTAKMVFNSQSAAHLLLQKEQAFYLAEAGLELGKVELAENPNWSTKGLEVELATGKFRVTCEQNANIVYSTGFAGKAVVILRFNREEKTWDII